MNKDLHHKLHEMKIPHVHDPEDIDKPFIMEGYTEYFPLFKDVNTNQEGQWN